MTAGRFAAPGTIARAARVAAAAIAFASGALIAGCAGRGMKPFVVPAGTGEPVPEFAQLFEEATKPCRGIRTLTAEAGLSGRAGGQRLRGRLHLGLAEPDGVRIEGLAPFGPPAFVLAAQNGEGTLLLPRDNAVVRGVPTAELIEALAGVKVSGDELRAIATGCVAPAPKPTGGQRFPNGITTIALQGDATAYLDSRNGTPRIVASQRPGLFVQYDEHLNGLPRSIGMRNAPAATAGSPGAAASGEPSVTLQLTVTQLETNVQLEPAAFKVDVPADARPLTLEELRRAGPLGREGK